MSNDALLLGWRKLWNRSLHRFIGRRVDARVDIEDLAQETYLRVLRARDLSDVRNPKAYLLRVAANVVSEWRHHQPPPTLFEPVEDNFAPMLEVEAVVSQSGLDEVLADLPAMTRAVVLFRFRDNLPCRDIARKGGGVSAGCAIDLGAAVERDPMAGYTGRGSDPGRSRIPD